MDGPSGRPSDEPWRGRRRRLGATTEAEGPFVGRDHELEQLEGALEDAVAGNGRLVLIGGEPGIGKTRLADELAGLARSRGARVLWGRCWEAGGAPAYWPWVQAIRSYFRETDPETLLSQLDTGAAEIAQMIPELYDLFPELRAPPALDPEGARFRLFDATWRFLQNAAQVRPLVLILDDLHAADDTSLLLLRFAASGSTDAHILIVATYRDEGNGRGHPLGSALAELARQPETRHLDLGGLAESDVARFMEATTRAVARDAVVATIHRRTEGNPLFVVELVRLLAAEGSLERDPAILETPIPSRIRDVIDRRLARLSEACIGLLTSASVLGREFDTEALRRTTGSSGDALLDSLDEAVVGRIVTEVPGGLGRMRFSHALIRDAIYEGLGPRQRIQLHRAVGEALETLYQDDLAPHLAELAHHFHEAAPVDGGRTAVDYAWRAGQQAVSSLAYEYAVRLLGLGLEASRLSADEGTHCRLLLSLGDAQARAGDTAGARETFLRAADLARQRNMPEELAHAALGYGGRFVWARAWGDTNLIPLLQEALELLPEDDSPLRVRLLARLAGGPLRDTVPVGPREAMSQEALDMARRLGDPATLAYALEGRHCSNMGPEVLARRLEIAEELIAVSETVGDRERAFGGHNHRLHALLEAGDMRSARLEYRALQRSADELRQPAQHWFAAVNGAKLALFEGRLSDARRATEEAAQLGRSARSVNVQMAFDLQSYALLREEGRLGEIADAVMQAVDDHPTYPVWRYVLVDVLAQLDRRDETRAAFDELAEDGFQLYLDMQWLFGMSLAAEVCGYLRDTERAPVLYDQLYPYSRHHAVLPPELCRGSVSRELGTLAATMSRWDAAIGHFNDAMTMNVAMGARPWVAYTEHDHARMLLERDEPGDREAALERLTNALEVCRDSGLVALEGKIAALLEGEALQGGDEVASLVAVRSVERGHRRYTFRREGDYWSIRFEGEAFRVKDSKGLRYLAELLGHPGREILALELATAGLGSVRARPVPATAKVRSDPPLHLERDRGTEILDPQAKDAYRRRIEELQDDLEEAEARSDPDRAARARDEIDLLAHELAVSVGLGGADRRTPSEAERARVSVTKAIRSAVARIGVHSPRLARHLAITIRTGTYCSYVPDPDAPPTWQR